jgi:hypothetical protein
MKELITKQVSTTIKDFYFSYFKIIIIYNIYLIFETSIEIILEVNDG